MPPSSQGRSASQSAGARRRRRARALACAAAAAALAACVFGEHAPPREPLPDAPHVGPAECRRIEYIEIVKSERRLRARCAGGAVLNMTAALSREPTGPKRARGDQRTPEGIYRIAGSARRSRFHLYIPIDYPSRRDAERALGAGVISTDTNQRIVVAHSRGELPPQDTPLGGGLGLHGEGERWRGDSRWHDWTNGCIALADEDIDRIARLAPVGTPVEIRP